MLHLPPLISSFRRRQRPLVFTCIGLMVLAGMLLPGARVDGSSLLIPTATPALPVPTPKSEPATIHVVAEDEALWTIAQIYGVTLDALIAVNQLENPDLVQIGQELIIPSPDQDQQDVAATPTKTPTSPPTPPARPATKATTRPVAQATPSLASPAQRTPVATTLAVGGLRSVCPSNVATYDLALPGDPIHLLLAGDWLYLIAKGDLYRLSAAALADGQVPQVENLMPAERKVGRYEIRELVYGVLDPASGDLLLLDKSDDVFRLTSGDEWSLPFPATPIPDQFPDPQFLAVQPPAGAPQGSAFVLDADLSTIWQLLPGSGLPRPYWAHNRLLDALDLHTSVTASGDTVFTVLMRDGSVAHWAGGDYTMLYRPPPSTASGRQPWLSHLLALEDGLAIVDAQARTITAIDTQTGDLLWSVDFRLPGMQRLRSAALRGDTLFAAAGGLLHVADIASSETCTSVLFDDGLYFHGQDLQALLPDLGPPFSNAIMPDRPRSYPGARRLYRNGIHAGVDLYSTDALGVGMGSSVSTVADGSVVRADTNFVEMLPGEYEAAISRTIVEHRTPPDLHDAFLGRQVHVLHSPGVESRYGHLSAVAEGIAPEVTVTQGDAVGAVGVSGTSAGAYGTADGVHLHFEIWIDGQYLGQGLSLYETMRLWQALFPAKG